MTNVAGLHAVQKTSHFDKHANPACQLIIYRVPLGISSVSIIALKQNNTCGYMIFLIYYNVKTGDQLFQNVLAQILARLKFSIEFCGLLVT